MKLFLTPFSTWSCGEHRDCSADEPLCVAPLWKAANRKLAAESPFPFFIYRHHQSMHVCPLWWHIDTLRCLPRRMPVIMVNANIIFPEKGLELETVHRCCRNEGCRHTWMQKWQTKVSVHGIHFPVRYFLSIFFLLFFFFSCQLHNKSSGWFKQVIGLI